MNPQKTGRRIMRRLMRREVGKMLEMEVGDHLGWDCNELVWCPGQLHNPKSQGALRFLCSRSLVVSP